MRLGPQAQAAGYRVESFDAVGSTNDIAMARARAGDPGKLWIVAAEQTGGRGRQGRPWRSPAGNLHASLLLVAPCAPALAPQIGFIAGVALMAALDRFPSMAGRARLKWPNDALVDAAKLAGVLLEATTLPNGAFACVLGVGVNCAAHPQDLPYPATDLRAQGVDISPGELFAALSDEWPRWLALWRGGEDFAAIRDAWLAHAAGLGAAISVRQGERVFAGVFVGLDASGRLVVETPTGNVSIDAGDVAPATRPDGPASDPAGERMREDS